MLHEYPHFNPKRYDLDVKIATVRTGSHCNFNINCHIIWIPKYRKKLLKGKVKEALIQADVDEGPSPLSVNFEAVVFGGNPPYTNYEWDIDYDGVTDYTGQKIDHTFIVSGYHMVQLKVADSNNNEDTVIKIIIVEQ